MASTSQHVKLAQSLPPKLLRFFARYPPQAILTPGQSINTSESSSPLANTASSDVNASSIESLSIASESSPFRATKHPITGRWHDPVFSLRRQADLVKLARQHGVADLMPFSVKSDVEKLRRRQENGLRVKGTGVGERVKGKESERTLKGRYVINILQAAILSMILKYYQLLTFCFRLEKRRQAMLNMPQMIQTWKEVSLILRCTFSSFNMLI